MYTRRDRVPLICWYLNTVLGCLFFALSLHAVAQDTPATQQAVIEIVRLQHRDPASVRDAIAPHLDPRGAISQIDRNLIISTSRANFDELADLIATLDVPLQQLLIRVDFAYGVAAVQVQADGSQVNTVSTQTVREYPQQSIVVTEGQYAYFNRFQSTPRVNAEFGPYGLQLRQDLQRAEQSLAVRPAVQGDQVMLDITLSVQNLDPVTGATQGQQVQTQITLPLNQWKPLTPAEQGTFDASVTRVSTGDIASGVLAVRVEAMP